MTGSGTRVPPGAWALLVFPVCFWGGGYTATTIATEHTPALMLAALRCLPPLVAIPVAMLFGMRLPRGANLRGGILSGLLVVVVFVLGTTLGAHNAGAANAAVLASAAPLWVAVLGRSFLRERVSPVAAVGLALGFAGIVVMVARQLGGAGATGDLRLGIAMSAIAGLAWASGTLMVRRLAVRDPKLDFVGLTAVQYLVGCPILVAVGFAAEGTGSTDWASVDMWGAALWLGLGSAVLATAVFFMSLRWLDAAKTSSVQFLVPVVAVGVELVRGHAPSGLALIGIALAIGGVFLVVAGERVRGALARRLAAG
jgi:drug/metabolite transporter (DMT)-like permease